MWTEPLPAWRETPRDTGQRAHSSTPFRDTRDGDAVCTCGMSPCDPQFSGTVVASSLLMARPLRRRVRGRNIVMGETWVRRATVLPARRRPVATSNRVWKGAEDTGHWPEPAERLRQYGAVSPLRGAWWQRTTGLELYGCHHLVPLDHSDPLNRTALTICGACCCGKPCRREVW